MVKINEYFVNIFIYHEYIKVKLYIIYDFYVIYDKDIKKIPHII